MSIFRSYIFNNNDEVIYHHKLLNLSNDRKFEFLSQFDLYVLKKLLNFTNEKRAKVNKDTNKVNEFEYFKKKFIVFESTFLISVKICLFLKHNIHKRLFFFDTAVTHDTFHKIFYYFLLYDVISEFFLSYLFY